MKPIVHTIDPIISAHRFSFRKSFRGKVYELIMKNALDIDPCLQTLLLFRTQNRKETRNLLWMALIREVEILKSMKSELFRHVDGIRRSEINSGFHISLSLQSARSYFVSLRTKQHFIRFLRGFRIHKKQKTQGTIISRENG